MKIKMVIRAYDDLDKECAEGDKILIQTKNMKSNMQEPAAATIVHIDVYVLTVHFDDPLIARGNIMLKPAEIETMTYMKSPKSNY